MTKTVCRVVIYEGDAEWVDFVLSRSLPVGKRDLGGYGNFIEIYQEPKITRSPKVLAEERRKPYVNAVEAAAELRGWQQCLSSVRASLEDYPNAGGDTIIMEAVDRIVKKAIEETSR